MEGEGVSMNPRAIAIAFVLVASGGQTDEGELSVGFETTPGWYWVSMACHRTEVFRRRSCSALVSL
jgi:hypothetical protein